MVIKKVIQFFPPTHDFSMPYSSLGILKNHLEKNCNINIVNYDLNLMFYQKLIGQDLLFEYRSLITPFESSDTSIDQIIPRILEVNDKIDKKLNSNNIFKSKGYRLSQRKITPPYDYLNKDVVYKEINKKESPLYIFFEELISIHNIKGANLFGINISVEDQILPSLILCSLLRETYPLVKIVLGGNIISRIHTKFYLFFDQNLFDYLVYGEGELAYSEIISSLNTKREIDNKFTNIITKNKTSDYTKIKGEYPYIQEPKKLSSANFSDYDLNNYKSLVPVIPILASRKCAWGKCEFCSIHTGWTSYRMREISSILSEIESYISKGFSHFRFVDENLNPNIIKKLVKGIKERKLVAFFEAYVRFENKFLDTNYCNELYNAGFRQLFFGLESIGNKTINLIVKTKTFSKDNIKDILFNTDRAGILNYVFVLTGIPNSDVNEENETVEFIINNKSIHTISLGSFVIDAQSPIHLNEKLHAKYKIKLSKNELLSTEYLYNTNSNWSSEIIKERAKQYTNRIYSARPDLAIASLLDEEERFILCSLFGNSFIEKFAERHSKIDNYIAKALSNSIKHKIDREL